MTIETVRPSHIRPWALGIGLALIMFAAHFV
jgi:hypothetical protein